MVTRNKGHIVERFIYVKIIDSSKFKVHGILYTDSFNHVKRIPPHLLVTTDERLASIGTQLEILFDQID